MNTTKRQLQKDHTRKKILDTALLEFGKNGILNTRMSDIAKAANVSHGTVFSHFETQEALISAVIETFGSSVTFRTHELASNCAGVRDVLQAHLTGIMEVEKFYTRLVIETRLLPQVSRETFVIIQSAISLHLSEAAQREMKAGTIAVMPIPLLFNTWMGLIHYYLTNGDLFAPEGSVLKRYGADLLDHFMNLLQPKYRMGSRLNEVNKMSDLQKLPNIGKTAESMLMDAGIHSPEELIRIGSKEAFLRIRLNDQTACLHMLYGLEGAIEGIRDADLSEETKQNLKAFYKTL